MNFKKLIQSILLLALLATAQMQAQAQTQTGAFAYGADVGWVDQEEASGYSFYNSQNVKTDPFVLLKALNVNAIRLRVWVNPAGGCIRPNVLQPKGSVL